MLGAKRYDYKRENDSFHDSAILSNQEYDLGLHMVELTVLREQIQMETGKRVLPRTKPLCRMDFLLLHPNPPRACVESLTSPLTLCPATSKPALLGATVLPLPLLPT